MSFPKPAWPNLSTESANENDFVRSLQYLNSNNESHTGKPKRIVLPCTTGDLLTASRSLFEFAKKNKERYSLVEDDNIIKRSQVAYQKEDRDLDDDDEESGLSSGSVYFGSPKDPHELGLHASLVFNSDSYLPLSHYFFTCYNTPEGLKKLEVFLEEISKFDNQQLISRLGNDTILSMDYSGGRTLTKIPHTTWDDVILPSKTKREIQASVDGFFKAETIYKKLGIAWQRGIILTGLPGNGKTHTCRAIACNSGKTFINVRVSDRTSDSGLGQCFATARKLAPCILCLEDIDRLYANGRSATYLLNTLDGLTKTNDGVLIVATANNPEDLDPALVDRPSRFDRVFRVEKPDAEARTMLLERLTKDFKYSKSVLREVVDGTTEMSMTYIKEVTTQANLLAIISGREVPEDKDLLEALKSLKNQKTQASKKFDSTKNAGFNSAEPFVDDDY